MIEMLVWLLIVSPTSHHGGVPHTLATFKTKEECKYVLVMMDDLRYRDYNSHCVQANILVAK